MLKLYLTREEERMVQGFYGNIIQKSMELIVTLGDVFNAEKLVKISSAHISGISYKNIGEPGLEFLEEWSQKGATTRVPTTINPCGMDLERWRELGISETFAEKQNRIINAFKKMMTIQSLSCIPYVIGNKPAQGEHIAWAESSAVVFANSVLGARTNREGGPTALASAITGKTPLFGYHLDEQRKPTLEICVKEYVNGGLEYSALGYTIGEKFGQCIPLFKGLKYPSFEELKALSAGLAASGAIALYHIHDLTPEVGLFKGESYERVSIEKRDLAENIEKLSTGEANGHVCLGCPHCSIEEIDKIASQIGGKNLKRPIWIFTSGTICEEAKRKGYFTAIERAGGKLISDTCMVVAPMREMGVKRMTTNSCKAAHYVPNTCGISVTLKSLRNCVEAALG